MPNFVGGAEVGGGGAFINILIIIHSSMCVGPSDQENIVRSADGIDTTITFPADQETVEISFTLTDDTVGLEDIESYIATLELVGTPEGVVIGDIPETTVNVLDNEGI